ncbi:MAG: hypothetical protein SV186_04630 [Candidatus Nanohaloarchaea archaeon]|nr:hypothetical protein [Candidatus Nanohaloarchaea archaeon]
MEIAIKERRDNPLLEREEFELEIEHEGDATPSNKKVRKSFAAENDLDPDKIEVDHIYTGHGHNVSTALVRAYENKVVVEEDDGADEEAQEESEPDNETDGEAEAEEEASDDESKADEGDA